MPASFPTAAASALETGPGLGPQSGNMDMASDQNGWNLSDPERNPDLELGRPSLTPVRPQSWACWKHLVSCLWEQKVGLTQQSSQLTCAVAVSPAGRHLGGRESDPSAQQESGGLGPAGHARSVQRVPFTETA